MIPVLLYSHEAEPITNIIINSDFDQTLGLIKISLDDLLNYSSIFDEIDGDVVHLNWEFKNGICIDNSNKYFLINRVISIPENLFDNFCEEDKRYAQCEFSAYITFATEVFANSFSKPGPYGLFGNRFSLPRQWDIVKKSHINVNIPQYFIGDFNYCKLKKEDLILSSPFNYYFWKKNHEGEFDKGSFFIEKPYGFPVVSYVIGDFTEVTSYDSSFIIHENITSIINKISLEISILFKFKILEILFFVDGTNITFGMVTNIPYASVKKEHFKDKVKQYLKSIIF